LFWSDFDRKLVAPAWLDERDDYSLPVITDFSLATIVSVQPARKGSDHSLGSILLFSGVGLLATLALMTVGIDLGAGWI
jgi:hypothetical protein